MASLKAGGTKVVTTHGTRVQLIATRTPCHSFLIQPKPSNTGKIYIGDVTVVGSTLVGLFGILLAPSATSQPTFGATNEPQANGFDLSQIYLDSDVDGEGVIFSYVEG